MLYNWAVPVSFQNFNFILKLKLFLAIFSFSPYFLPRTRTDGGSSYEIFYVKSSFISPLLPELGLGCGGGGGTGEVFRVHQNRERIPSERPDLTAVTPATVRIIRIVRLRHIFPATNVTIIKLSNGFLMQRVGGNFWQQRDNVCIQWWVWRRRWW